MKVASPIGDFPFEVSRLVTTRRGVTVHGCMGAWPARVEVDVSDLPHLARVARRPMLLAGFATIAAISVARCLAR
jgi:hypothetical protein